MREDLKPIAEALEIFEVNNDMLDCSQMLDVKEAIEKTLELSIIPCTHERDTGGICKTSCGKTYLPKYEARYCPFCGKPLEVTDARRPEAD